MNVDEFAEILGESVHSIMSRLADALQTTRRGTTLHGAHDNLTVQEILVPRVA